MPSLSGKELEILDRCIKRAAKGRKVTSACVYGSKVAGYSRPDSDIDVLLVLDEYPYKVKYAYMEESGAKVSALVVDKKSLENDASRARLGEFVVGRLLHVYYPVVNGEFLRQVEDAFKRRVILEEMHALVKSAGVLATEIWFPLEYVAFSKIKHRAALYPNAAYSYYRTYQDDSDSGNNNNGGRNLQAAMAGYRRALEDIIQKDGELLETKGDKIRISEKRLHVAGGEPALKPAKRLQEFGSYFVHSYAGRKMFHLAVVEAESKIRRHIRQPIEIPQFLSCPACEYLSLPEGLLVSDSRKQDWLGMVARENHVTDYCGGVAKRRLGNPNSRTLLYTLKHKDGELKLAVKDMSKSKSVKWAALSVWAGKKFRVDPLIRLGFEYKALRRLRKLGLVTPAIEAVVLDRRILVTRFIEGESLASAFKAAISGGDTQWIRKAGEQIASVHAAGYVFGNIKPKNIIIIGDKGLCFTDLDQFALGGGDPAWDVAEFLCWGLKGTGNASAAARITREFLSGYKDESVPRKIAASRRYVETFYPVLAPTVAQAIKNEMKK
ncbi:MAG: nucleotidyltransferase domain-containing protein [Nitrososphaera sp.]|jgi:tRNA A-37 threonylcarbamoyl transferase component Bud32/predicted nucleotidyltransferase